MNWSNRSILGVAIEDSSITVCELRGLTNDRLEQLRNVRGAVFRLHEGLSFDQPVALGQALAEFLSEHRFTARRAAVGLPANWFMVQPNRLPPGDDEESLAGLRLTAERAFTIETSELVMDAWLDSGEGDARQAVLVAAHKDKVEAIQTMAEQARLKLFSVSSSLMAIAAAMKLSTARESLLLRIAPTNVAVLHRQGDTIALFKPLSVGGPTSEDGASEIHWMQRLASELRRMTVSLPSTNGLIGADQITVWDDAGVSADAIDCLHQELALPIEQPDHWVSLGMDQESSNRPSPDRSWAVGAAVVFEAMQSRAQRIDLLKSRLAQPVRQHGRRTRWIALIVVAMLIICVGFAADVTRNLRVISGAGRQLAEIEPLAELAAQLRDKVTFARGWYDRRPEHIDCLVALTTAFPETGTVWASNVTIRPDMSGVATAIAVDEPSALAVFDALRMSPNVSNVKLAYLRQTDRKSQEVSFSLTFRFQSWSDS